MVVKCKEEVYNWFQQVDSSNRVDFICTILEHYCSPWEIRFFGTCIEQLARKSYHVFKDYDFNKKTDYQALQDRMIHPDIHILDQTEDISRLIMALSILRSRPPDALCSSVPYLIISEISKHLREQLARVPPTTEVHKQLIKDVRLLLAIAIHHPAFSFDQRKDFQNQLDEVMRFLKQWSESVDEINVNMRDVQCQTDFTQEYCEVGGSTPVTACQTKAPTPGTLLVTDRHQSHTHKPYHINSLTLKGTRNTKSEIKYKIEVSYSNSEQQIVEKSHQDIKVFHDKMLTTFPDDVKSPKRIRNIPLLSAVDISDLVISRYLRELCKMKIEFLDSQPMRDFFHVCSSSSSSSQSKTTKGGSSAKDTGFYKSVETDETLPKLAVTGDGEEEDGGMSESEGLTLPMHTFIVTNSSKYQSSVSSVNTTASSHCRTMTTSTSPSHPPTNQMLQMTKDDFKAKGMVEGAARKLRDHMDSMNRNCGQITVHVSGKSAHMKTGFHHSPLSCESSNSDVSSPRTSPYRPGIHNSPQGIKNQRQLLFPGDAAMHSTLETSMKPERATNEVRRSQSSNNLYAFPVSPNASNASMTTSTDSLQKKATSPRHSDVAYVSIPSVNQQSFSNNSSLTTYPDPSSTSKPSKHTSRSNSTSTPHSPRTDKSHGSNHPPSKQKSDSAVAASAGKPLTVEEIQQRQAQQRQAQQQALQRQHSVEVSIVRDSSTQPHKTETAHQSSSVPNMQPPSASRPSQPTQYHPPHSHQTSSQVIVSPIQVQAPAPVQQVKPKQQVASVSVHKGQHKPASSSKIAQVSHRQPTPPPPQHLDNQQSVTRQEKHAKSKRTTYSTQSTSPVQADSSSVPTSTADGACNDHPSDDSDSLSVNEVAVSAKTDARPSQLHTLRHGESVDQSAGSATSTTRSHSQVDSMSESVELKDRITSPAPTAVVMQQPYMAANMEDIQFMTAPPINGYMDRVVISGADGATPYAGNVCMCQKCAPGPFYMSIPAGPPPRPSHPPPSLPPQHQNGMVYGFTSGFLGPSNGMINPGMHQYNRPNSQGAMPNGMIQRGDVVYQPMSYVPANTSRSGYHNAPAGVASIPPHQFQPAPSSYQFYAQQAPAYTKRVMQCTNCGMSNHSRNECTEPFDNTAYMNEYHLDIQPRSEISE